MQSTPASFRAVAVWPGAAPKRRVSLAPMRPPCQAEADDPPGGGPGAEDGGRKRPSRHPLQRLSFGP